MRNDGLTMFKSNSSCLSVLLGLGSNLGDRLGYLQAGVDGLKRLSDNDGFNISLKKASSVYETPPWGIDNTPAYLNAAIVLDIIVDNNVSDISAALNTLLQVCQSIEVNADRQRIAGNQFAARTLDIDILYAVYQDSGVESIGENIKGAFVNTAHLTIPHPRLALRAFALKPALEVWHHTSSRAQLMAWYQMPEVQRDACDVILKTEYHLY
jgi:2-amino-4-hydroxy-6-hydroxymethyldihydropteridine diphosphokinase